jgi:catechol 2,3-dioxygenase-like lactoylglutathione lyase family enzyme
MPWSGVLTREHTGASTGEKRDGDDDGKRDGGHMASTDVGSATSPGTTELSTIDMALEVVVLPVSDVDRAKRFYQSLGWRFDIDLVVNDQVRTVQFTPPHSPCSIQFGLGATTAEPGSAQGMILVVADIDAARSDLMSRGVEVSEIQEQRPPGIDAPPGRSYFARASFSDPDGNRWVLQEVTTRIPGRTWDD